MLKWWRTRTTTREIAKRARDTAVSAERRGKFLHRRLGRWSERMPESQVVSFAPTGEDEVWAAPTRAHQFDAGVDLRISKGVTLAPGASAKVPTATTVQIPEGYFGLLAIRSGIGAKGVTLLNGVGIIDHGYEGEIGLILANFGGEEWSAAPGDRIAQLIVVPCVTGVLGAITSTRPRAPESERGEGGFGSTG